MQTKNSTYNHNEMFRLIQSILEALQSDLYQQRRVHKLVRRDFPELLVKETPSERVYRDMEWSGEHDLLKIK